MHSQLTPNQILRNTLIKSNKMVGISHYPCKLNIVISDDDVVVDPDELVDDLTYEIDKN